MIEFRSICFILALATIGTCASQDETDNGVKGRRLQEISATSLESFADGETVRPGDTILLNAKEILLTEGWVVLEPNVTIQGLEDKKTVIVCSLSTRALTIRAPGARVNDVVFKNCVVDGAVKLENTEEKYPVVDASFHRAEFRNNELSFDLWSDGAALSVGDGCSASVFDGIFDNNIAPSGGAIFVDRKGRLQVNRCSFYDNVSLLHGGGAIYSSGSLSVHNCTFKNCRSKGTSKNPAPSGPLGRPRETFQWYTFPEPGASGGAILIYQGLNSQISESIFEGNTATAGGALSVSFGEHGPFERAIVEVRGCSFRNNSAIIQGKIRRRDLDLGGAIFLSISRPNVKPTIMNSTFDHNSARFGGALHVVTTDETSVEITRCQFDYNRAWMGGGAVVLRNTGSTTWVANKVRGNIASIGGGLLLTNNAYFSGLGQSRSFDGTPVAGEPLLFENNTAIDGGGIACAFCGVTLFQDPLLRNNQAGRNGGGISIRDALSEVFLQHLVAEGNTALRGGGIFVDAAPHFRITATPRASDANSNKIASNTAVYGGGLYISARNRHKNIFLISQVEFLKNEAIPLEAHLETLNAAHEVVGKPSLAVGREHAAEARENGAGGGMFLVLDVVPSTALADVVLTKLQFTRNTATVGGGVLMVAGESLSGADVKGTCPTNPDFLEKPCQNTRLIVVNFHKNSATLRDPAFSVSNAASVRVSCTRRGPSMPLDDMEGFSIDTCFTMSENKLQD